MLEHAQHEKAIVEAVGPEKDGSVTVFIVNCPCYELTSSSDIFFLINNSYKIPRPPPPRLERDVESMVWSND